MLILTHRPGESVLIDNPLSAIDCAAKPMTVTVLGIKGNQVRIGIEAPADITILREKLVPSGVQNLNTSEVQP
ncbi:MAG: carbon storage regulator [Thiogranum sp.]